MKTVKVIILAWSLAPIINVFLSSLHVWISNFQTEAGVVFSAAEKNSKENWTEIETDPEDHEAVKGIQIQQEAGTYTTKGVYGARY